MDLSPQQMEGFQAACAERGVFLKWFGREQAVGFTSSYHNWEYMAESATLPQMDAVMGGLFDMRIPLNLTGEDMDLIAGIMRESMTLIVAR